MHITSLEEIFILYMPRMYLLYTSRDDLDYYLIHIMYIKIIVYAINLHIKLANAVSYKMRFIIRELIKSIDFYKTIRTIK